MGNANQKGSALLAVLWLTAALAAISFTVANSVRGETERTATASEGLRAYYLAAGAVDRATNYMFWGPQYRNPDGSPMFYDRGMARLYFQFPTGAATVEIIPETAKLSLNQAPPTELTTLLMNLGTPPERAAEIVAAIVDWRTPGAAAGPFDQFYSSVGPSFRSRHASFEEIEELLLVKGMTPELFYGSFTRDPQGRLLPLAGLRNCVSVYNGVGPVDVNSAEPAVLATVGVPPEAIGAILQRRSVAPFLNTGELQSSIPTGPAGGRLVVGGNTVFTLRSTAQVRLPDGRFSDLRRTIAAVIKFREAGVFPPVETLRWYDNY